MTADEGPPSSPDDSRPRDETSPSTSSTPTAESREGSPAPDSQRSEPAADAPGADGTDESGGGGEPDEHGATESPLAQSRENAGGSDTGPDPVPGTRTEDRSFARRLWHAETGPLFFLREVLTSVGAVLLVGLLLFGISGVWPPMVAVESGSMEPHMHKGDLVFITEPGRYTPDSAYEDTGVVTAEIGDRTGYRTFGDEGSVIVYDDPGRGGPPIIHRAVFYVDEGENWYPRADPAYISADDCSELMNCPAPHAGFITKGDANGRYDQASGISGPVKPAWITGIARLRIPYLGWVRLGLAGVIQPEPSVVGPTPVEVAVDVRPEAGGDSEIDPESNVGVPLTTARLTPYQSVV